MKKRLFTLLICFIPFLSLCAVPPAWAQPPEGCTEYSSADANSDGYYSLTFGSLYPTDANTVAGDFFGYRVIYEGAVNDIDVVYYQVGGAFGGVLFTFDVPGTYTVSVHTDGLSVNTNNPPSYSFSAYVCLPIAPTSTPTATSTATPTPTEVVIVTATSVPPTPTPVPAVEAILSDIRDLNYNQFLWALFAGVSGLGVLSLVFLRVRR